MPKKQEQNRQLVEGLHPPEPGPEPDAQAEEVVARLFGPKAGSVELVRQLHPDEPT
jgi:hypothetical protein